MCSTSAPQGSARAEEASLDRTAPDRVGIVLVSHSREVAAATAELAKALTGMDDPAPIAAAGGTEDGRIGTSAELVRQALKEVDGGKGVAVVCDMGSAVLTLKALLAEGGLADGVRIADTPFVEGAVAALVTASVGGDLDMVIAAADDARGYRKM
ncbi:dihydroxyacetone kinase phosphoryl donor subunit DhaM [Streptomyces sp. NBC_01304]|nr:dihydroxyacetone kinase phosphoryl donor subunit DhaM [Streptomyces sp. NBC_01304]